jgi:EAL domain-containing protein (putative c-di-GMP-specific phosphodiesterase class I)
VLRAACHQSSAWQAAGLPRLPVAVNVSAKQFRNRNFVSNVRSALEEAGLEPQYLELEVTETVVMQDADEVISTLEELRQLGVKLAIDDFGTGYSSLSYLKRFPIEKIKIDGSFVRDIPGDRDDYSIVRAIIGLTQQLNLKVLAEGVETREQLDALRIIGCDEYQGFYFSEPVSAESFEQVLRDMGLAGEWRREVLPN